MLFIGSRTGLRRWAGNILAVCIGVSAVAVLLAAAEGVLRLKVHLTTAPENVPVTGRLDGALRHAGILGVEGTPNGAIHCLAVRGERVLYDTSCKTDAAGRRLTPCAVTAAEADVALFFGCSMTFGLGVEDDDTLPARYCALAPHCCSLNYGLAGYGPQQMWLQICKQHVLKEFGSRKGVIVYTFIDDHIFRLIGTPAIVSEWSYPLPWLALQDGRIEYCGTFFDRSPLQYLFLHYVQRTHLARFVENRLPRRQQPEGPSADAADFLAAVVRECADTAAREAPGLKFHCLIPPKFLSSQWGKPLAERLAGSDARVLDYSDLFEKTSLSMDELFFDDNSLYKWGHLKPAGYELLAEQMNRDIHPDFPAQSRPAP
jgi:hypothetical protein